MLGAEAVAPFFPEDSLFKSFNDGDSLFTSIPLLFSKLEI